MGVFHLKSDHFSEIDFTCMGMLSFRNQNSNFGILGAEILMFDLMYYSMFYDTYLLSSNR